MPWVISTLRGQRVWARADERGALVAAGGRVEIRYNPNDGRKYQARADNLQVVDPTPLPDATCSEAGAVPSAKEKAAAKAAGKRQSKKAAAAGAPTVAAEGGAIAYADGACTGNPGPAGLGVVVLDGPKRVEVSEYLGEGTNNIAELSAIDRALDEVDAARPYVIHTDSQYAIGVLAKGWKAKANVELIQGLRARLKERSATTFRYVPGHSGVPLNERADELARDAVKRRGSKREVTGPT